MLLVLCIHPQWDRWIVSKNVIVLFKRSLETHSLLFTCLFYLLKPSNPQFGCSDSHHKCCVSRQPRMSSLHSSGTPIDWTSDVWIGNDVWESHTHCWYKPKLLIIDNVNFKGVVRLFKFKNTFKKISLYSAAATPPKSITCHLNHVLAYM